MSQPKEISLDSFLSAVRNSTNEELQEFIMNFDQVMVITSQNLFPDSLRKKLSKHKAKKMEEAVVGLRIGAAAILHEEALRRGI